MKTNYLLPNGFKKIGWIMLALSIVYFVVYLIVGYEFALNFTFKMPSLTDSFKMVETDFSSTILPIIALIAFNFVAFSKEKDEDEYIGKLREGSFVFSVLVSSVLFVISTLLIYSLDYFWVVYLDYFVFLLIFALKFQFELCRFRKENKDEE